MAQPERVAVPLSVVPVTIGWPSWWARMRAARLPCGSSTCDPGNDTNSPRGHLQSGVPRPAGQRALAELDEGHVGELVAHDRGRPVCAADHDYHLERLGAVLLHDRPHDALDPVLVVARDHDRGEHRPVEVEGRPSGTTGKPRWARLPAAPRSAAASRLV